MLITGTSTRSRNLLPALRNRVMTAPNYRRLCERARLFPMVSKNFKVRPKFSIIYIHILPPFFFFTSVSSYIFPADSVSAVVYMSTSAGSSRVVPICLYEANRPSTRRKSRAGEKNKEKKRKKESFFQSIPREPKTGVTMNYLLRYTRRHRSPAASLPQKRDR